NRNIEKLGKRKKGGAPMNILTLPVQHKSQTQRPVVKLETAFHSSACGHDNPPEAAYCGECGAMLSPQNLRCSTCGQATPARLKFCRNGGADHSPAPVSAFSSAAATRSVAGEQFSQSAPHTPKRVAKVSSPQGDTRDIAHGAPLVGREAELTQLQTLFETALQGKRQVVFVTGEAGIGKTRLVDAFLAQIRNRADVRITSGQCVEQYGPGEAYLPLLEATTRLCRGPGGERYVEALHRYAPSWLVQLPGLLDPADRAPLQQRVQGTSQERMLREMAEAAELFTRQRGLIVVL